MKLHKEILNLSVGVLLLCGCEKAKPVHDLEIPYLLFVAPSQDHPLWLQAKRGFFDACEEEGYHCDWLGLNTIDTAMMNDIIRSGVLQKADAIITQGVVDEHLIHEAVMKNIPVVLVDSDMPSSNRTVYFGKDFQAQAKQLLKEVQSILGMNKKLTIAIQVAEQAFEIGKEQIEQVHQVFATHPGGAEIVALSSSKSDQVRAKQEWSATFLKHPHINVALALTGESVAACYESASSMGLHEQMLIFGVDDMEATIQLLEEGNINGTIATSFYDDGYDAVKFLHDHFQHPDERKETLIPVNIQLITPETVQEYII